MFGKKSNIIGILISTVCLWLVFRKVDWERLGQALQQLQPFYLGCAIAVFLLTFFVRTLRWQVLLNPAQPIAYWRLFSVIFIGYMANNLLPARLGEFVRAYVLSHKAGVRKSTTLATIFIERIFDGLSLLAMLGVLMLLYATNILSLVQPFPEWVLVSGVFAGVVFVGAFGFVIVLEYAPQVAEHLRRLIAALASPALAQRLVGILEAFVDGVACLRSVRRLLFVFAASLVIWLIEATTYYLAGAAFNMQLGFDAFLVTMVIVNLGSIAPSAPGYIGTFQAFCITALGWFGVAHETGLAFGLVLNVAENIPVTLLGLMFLLREHLGLGTLLRGNDTGGTQASDNPRTMDVAR